jgi:hypothetical protein
MGDLVEAVEGLSDDAKKISESIDRLASRPGVELENGPRSVWPLSTRRPGKRVPGDPYQTCLQQAASTEIPHGEGDEERLYPDEDPESSGLARPGYVREIGRVDGGE